MVLKRKTSEGLLRSTPSSVAAAAEEFVHGYFDIMSNTTGMPELIEAGTAYYADAPLKANRFGQKTVTDPERVFQEAAGEYIGHRVGA